MQRILIIEGNKVELFFANSLLFAGFGIYQRFHSLAL